MKTIFRVRLAIASLIFVGFSIFGVYVLYIFQKVHAIENEKPALSYPVLPFPVVSGDFDPTQPLPERRPRLKFKPGDVLPMLVTRCNSDDVMRVYSIGREFVRLDVKQPSYSMAGDTRPNSRTTPVVRPGCSTTISTVHSVPSIAVPGVYYVSGVAEISGIGDRLKTWSVPFYSEPIEVIAP